MKKLRIWASVTLTLAVLGFVFLLLMFLALVDISRGEENVVLEWLVVKLGLVVILFVIVATLIGTGLVFKYFRDRDKKDGLRPPIDL